MCKTTVREKVLNQIALQHEMQSHGINLVNCGSCGSTFLHRTPEEELNCPYCGFTSDPCDFPDFFYTGMETNAEFNEDYEKINEASEAFQQWTDGDARVEIEYFEIATGKGVNLETGENANEFYLYLYDKGIRM